MVVGEFYPEVEVDVATETREMEDAIAAFSKTDFAGSLQLEDTYLVGLCVLCHDAQSALAHK